MSSKAFGNSFAVRPKAKMGVPPTFRLGFPKITYPLSAPPKVAFPLFPVANYERSYGGRYRDYDVVCSKKIGISGLTFYDFPTAKSRGLRITCRLVEIETDKCRSNTGSLHMC
jgi:hypothetical protein